MDRFVNCVSVELWSTRKVEAEMADFGFMRIVDFKMIGSFVNSRIWCDLLQLFLGILQGTLKVRLRENNHLIFLFYDHTFCI